MITKFYPIFFLIFFSVDAFADKISFLHKEIKSHCGRDINSKKAFIPLVRRAYLLCHTGDKIEIESGCFIKCLKDNIGNIIARRRKY